jgi:hypothetical protein
MSSAISSLCIALAPMGQYNVACNKAVEAGTKTNGTYQLVSSYEGNGLKYADQEGHFYFGNVTMDVLGAAGYSYRVFRDKSLDFKLPNIGFCDQMGTKLTPNTYTLNLKWNLPW